MRARFVAVIAVGLLLVGTSCSSPDEAAPPTPDSGRSGNETFAGGTTSIAPTTSTTTLAGSRHNVLVVMIDDATYEEIRVMQNVRSLLAEPGTTFSNFYTTTPNCCPSRSGFYLGQFPHNSGVRDNIPPLGGANAFTPHQNDSLGVWMQQAGYYTAQIGKYLNGWGNPLPPDNWQGGIKALPGWDHWFVDIDPSTYAYYDFKISDDGVERSWGHRPEDYQTDVTGAETVQTIKDAAATRKPWFVTWSPMSPHIASKDSIDSSGRPAGGFVPVAAEKYKDRFIDEPLPASPSRVFGADAMATADVRGKPAYVQARIAETAPDEPSTTSAYRLELAALQSVDEWIGTIHQTLDDLGQLDNTDIFFWSDNGLFHGEHGLTSKGLLYEEASHVPLIVRGPGFPSGKTVDQLTLNIDLTPTILSIAGAKATTALDGRNLAPIATGDNEGKGRAILLEQWYSYSKTTTIGLRVDQWSYFEWSTGEVELYDLANDPHQMQNIASDPGRASLIVELHTRLAALATCKGATCNPDL